MSFFAQVDPHAVNVAVLALRFEIERDVKDGYAACERELHATKVAAYLALLDAFARHLGVSVQALLAAEQAGLDLPGLRASLAQPTWSAFLPTTRQLFDQWVTQGPPDTALNTAPAECRS